MKKTVHQTVSILLFAYLFLTVVALYHTLSEISHCYEVHFFKDSVTTEFICSSIFMLTCLPSVDCYIRMVAVVLSPSFTLLIYLFLGPQDSKVYSY